ncbi:uncharacterized protein LOC141879906 [Acropora palmata]|uniref:uncharacterized protein LOC141879906 n=1 Tax=Acropora palmata TaxID=6131 RepID=UPI003DA1B2E6
MDKFVVKTPAVSSTKKASSHLPPNLIAHDRARKYPTGTFHVDDGLMFCSSCNTVIDHLRKSVVDKHLDSALHKQRAERNLGSKQQTLKTVLNCRTSAQIEKVKICQEWIRVCAAANISLHKSDNPLMRKFLQARVANGGAIPKCSQLRDCYLFDVYQTERAALKEVVANKQIALIVDELSDSEGRFVLDVMAVFLDFDELSPSGNSVAWLLDSHFLTETNNRTVSQAVVKTVHDYSIEYDNVRVFNSDNVSYMKKAFCNALSCLFPYCIHITCHSHIVNLVASDFKKAFKEVTEFGKCFRNLFYVPSGRKSRFMKFLQEALSPGESATMPPNPTTKSWSAWFDSVLYHADYFLLFADFIQEEVNRSRASASDSLLRLQEIYEDKSFMKRLHVQLAFLKVKAPTLMAYLNYFQERVPHVTQAHGKMERLLRYLDVNSKLEEKDLTFCFEVEHTFTGTERKGLVSLFSSAFTAAHSKLEKYVVDGAQPGSNFLDQVRVLDPRNLLDMDHDFNSIDSIPGFDQVPKEEWELYVNNHGPLAVKQSKDGNIDLMQFWKAKASTLPALYKIASCYSTTTIGSYEVERSFPAYNEILDEKRRSLDETTIRALHFLNWNLRIISSIEEEKEKQNNLPKGHDVTKETLKTVSERKAPLLGKASDMSMVSKDQQPDPVPATKARKRKIDVADQERNEAVSKKKKGKNTPGKQFRGSNLSNFLNASCVHDDDEKCQLPTNTQQCSPVISVHYGINQTTAQKFNNEGACNFPDHKQPLLSCVLNGTVIFKGNSVIDDNDRQSLYGQKTQDEDNYLSNFVIEAYLQLIASKGMSQGTKVEFLGWESFEKGFSKGSVQEYLKGKAPLMEQDIVLVPFNPGLSKHWFLLVVLPKEKQILVLDSKAAPFTKPSTVNAVAKMWRILQEIDNRIDANRWLFATNTPKDVPQQQNNYDCGVFLCFFARSLVLQSAVPRNSVPAFRCHMIVELHEQELINFTVPSIQANQYYAVEYHKTWYFGRALGSPDDNSCVSFKFLHSTLSNGERVFNWPRRDDIDTVHISCVFFGPAVIVGIGPFNFPQLNEVQQVYEWLKKCRKGT